MGESAPLDVKILFWVWFQMTAMWPWILVLFIPSFYLQEHYSSVVVFAFLGGIPFLLGFPTKRVISRWLELEN